MKKQILMLALATAFIPHLFAQETNDVGQSPPPADKTISGENPSPKDSANERRDTFKKRQLKLMEKALNEIGVTKEQRQEIIVLQEAHMEKMKANGKRMNEARRELSRLQDIGASMEELDAAIIKVSDAQAEQLRILVHNRREMEKILGKEKNDLLMQKAHEYFRKHGRRPGAGMPPRPTSQPIPGQDENVNQSPPPPHVNDEASGNAPPMP